MGLGEWRLSRDPRTVLAAYGLGSCVGLALCDPGGVAALAHVVLPDSRGRGAAEPAKYADTAVAHVVAALERAGADLRRLAAVLCGGASMFAFISPQASEIGAANVAVLRGELRRFGIPVAAEDVGGRRGRTVFLELNGRVVVQTVGQQGRELWALARGGAPAPDERGTMR